MNNKNCCMKHKKETQFRAMKHQEAQRVIEEREQDEEAVIFLYTPGNLTPEDL